MCIESRFSKRVQKYKKTATVLMVKNWKHLLSHYRRVLAKASFICYTFRPINGTAMNFTICFNDHLALPFIAVGFSQRLNYNNKNGFSRNLRSLLLRGCFFA
jgi:hypothetical protein